MGLASPTHLIIILVLILLLFGAKRIPELAKGLGEGMKEFKRGVNEIGDDKPENRHQATDDINHEAGREAGSGTGPARDTRS